MKFEGSENNLSYILGYALFSLLSAAFGLHSLLKSGYIYNKISFIFLIIPLIITFFYLVENPNTEHTLRIYLTFICIVFPVILIGLDMAKYKSLDRLRNILFLTFIIITIAMIRVLPSLISSKLHNLVTIFGGGNSQAMSYFISFAYTVGLFSLTHTKSKPKSRFLNLVISLSLIFLIFAAILGGGRGAFLVILISTITFMLKNFKRKYLPKVISAIIVIYLLFNYLVSELGNRFINSTTRIFAYINESGIDMDGSSNRGVFYENAFNLFSENMIFGSGIFKSTLKTGYSHNIFLDFLIQGGIVYFLLLLIVIISFFNKLNKILKDDSKNNLILVFIFYSFTLLLFSGTYLNESFFWFSLAYVFAYSLKPTMLNSEIK